MAESPERESLSNPLPDGAPPLKPIGTTPDGLVILPPGPDYIIRIGGWGFGSDEKRGDGEGQQPGVDGQQHNRRTGQECLAP
jgi:hypothetical protein